MKFDPLRSFELTEDEWQETVKAVIKEGFEDWDIFAPQIVAAVEQGYLDNHLQMLALWMRQRWMYLKDSNQLAPAYVAALKGDFGTDDGPVAAPAAGSGQRLASGLYTDYEFALSDVQARRKMIPDDGIRPERTYTDGEALRGEFKAHGYVFNKMKFIGKHFTSPVPVKPKALYRIDRIGRENITGIVVASVSGQSLGRGVNFRIDNQRHIFNI